MNILVVDDAMFMRRLLTNMLTKCGHTVVGEAINGSDALMKYRQLKPDVVTMDITMDNVNGIEGVKLIKDFDPMAKIIMCSAMGQQSMVLEAIKAGAVDFVVKPFDYERIAFALNNLK